MTISPRRSAQTGSQRNICHILTRWKGRLTISWKQNWKRHPCMKTSDGSIFGFRMGKMNDGCTWSTRTRKMTEGMHRGIGRRLTKRWIHFVTIPKRSLQTWNPHGIHSRFLNLFSTWIWGISTGSVRRQIIIIPRPASGSVWSGRRSFMTITGRIFPIIGSWIWSCCSFHCSVFLSYSVSSAGGWRVRWRIWPPRHKNMLRTPTNQAMPIFSSV